MPMFRPGQGFKKFKIVKKDGGLSNSGTVKKGGTTELGTITGILTGAKPEEKEQWKQLNHPVTHKITQHMPNAVAGETNYLVLEENGVKRFFYIQGVDNPGGLNLIMRYFVEERKDVVHDGRQSIINN